MRKSTIILHGIYFLFQVKSELSNQSAEAVDGCAQVQSCEHTKQVEDDDHNSDLDSVEMEIIDDDDGDGDDEGLVVLNEVDCEVTTDLGSSNGKPPGKCIDCDLCKFYFFFM
jgi:hypothetical protein